MGTITMKHTGGCKASAKYGVIAKTISYITHQFTDIIILTIFRPYLWFKCVKLCPKLKCQIVQNLTVNIECFPVLSEYVASHTGVVPLLVGTEAHDH